ncbi:copper resistance protein CopC [Microbacterium maritypicum]|uniref:copper resistance CopC family protein n=1 Tax=Microbacterium maritypicum TaxID=33918 RepID=UPI002673B8A4|nr:copper resistance CopC family protein [Microbacterium liquefaciens]WKT89589.1 copper resistance protein CopC [Microbacterium liquefaciens]
MPARTRRLSVFSAAAAFLVLLSVGATANPASAHDNLVASSPASGEQLALPPEQVTLQFSASIFTDGAEVVLNDSAGKNWIEGPLTINGPEVTANIAPGMPAGSYEVIWKVVSADGHPISEAIPFSVLEGAPVASPTPTPTPVATEETEEASPTPTATPTETNGAEGPEAWQIGLIISSVVLALGGIAIAVILITRRRSAVSKQEESDD